MEERWEAALALGRHTQITGELAAFASEHGERDRAVRQYALALHRSGRTTEALEVVRRHRRVLVEEFGLDPSAEIAELEQALLDDDPALLVETDGRPLRGYRLLEEIGAGSFAVVWRGTQPSVGRDVAIKQIRRELATQPAFIRRFEAEAHLVARIEHPHVVPLIDFWRDPDSAYLVMRWLRGGTLERRLDDGPLRLEETLAVARQIGGALAAAHAHGVVHRDVKTANILFDEADNAFLTDFGIALEATRSSGPEAALSPGSPAYSSPEQLRQEPLGPPSDVFSLGVVLYECLSGSLPFGGVSAVDVLVQKQLHEPYPPLSELRHDVSVQVSNAIEMATAKEPAERFATVEEFVAALEAASGDDAGAQPPGEPMGALENPYLGLLAFDAASADRFFGRERLVADLVVRLGKEGTGSRCLVIVGPSGSGKSSLARAGLLPALRQGAVPGSSDWFITTLTPGQDPFELLEAALLRVAVNPPPTLLEQLRDGKRGILRGVRRCLPSEAQRLVVLIDQLEELFVGRSRQDADEFLDALAVAVTDPSSPLRLVATLRADYYGQPLEHPAFAAVLDTATANVTPLAGDELERVIVEPARALGVEYEPGLVTRIAAESVGQPSPLPLLQYTLAELFERRDDRTLTTAAYDDIGGLTGALAARAEAIWLGADAQQQEAIRRIFGRLIDPAEETADLRRRPRSADLGDDAATSWVLRRYGAARLITFDRDAVTREPTVEVAHEALLREWPRLVGWLREDRALLQAVDALAEAAGRWDNGGRADDDLLRGARLEGAAQLAATDPAHIRPLDLEFVAASTKAAQASRDSERRGRRRLRLLAGAVGAALAVALVAGGLALLQQSRADEEAQAATVAQGQAQLLTLLRRSEAADPATGILLALEAQRRAPIAETDRALLAALARASDARRVATFEPLEPDSCAAIWPGWVSRDGGMQSAAVEGIAVTRDLVSGEISQHLPMPDDACGDWHGDAKADRRYAVSQLGDRLWLGPFEGPWEHEIKLDGRSWVSGADGLAGSRLLLEAPGGVSLVDTSSGVRVGVPIFGLDEDPVVALSDDGTLAAIATPVGSNSDRAGTVVLIDAKAGEERTRTQIDGAVTALWISAERLLVGTDDGRLFVVDLETDNLDTSVLEVAAEAIVGIDAREDGGALVVVDGSPRSALIVGPDGGLESSADIDGLDGAALRTDGTLVSWDTDRRVEVLELEGEPLVVRSIDLAGIDDIGRDDWVVLGDGHAVVYGEEEPYVVFDLTDGARINPDLTTPDGTRFPATADLIVFEGGHAAISTRAEVGLWKEGEMVDRRDLAPDATAMLNMVAWQGTRLALGTTTGLTGAADRVHLIELGGDAVVELMTLEEPGPIIGALPNGDDGLFVLRQDGTLLTYDVDGALIDEDPGAFDVSVPPTAFGFLDGGDQVAIAHASPTRDWTQISLFDRGDDASSTFRTPGEVATIGFARGGEALVIQGRDGSVRLHDVEAGVTSPVIWDGNGAPNSVPWYDEATDSGLGRLDHTVSPSCRWTARRGGSEPASGWAGT